MQTQCSVCHEKYDDARSFSFCPHPLLMSESNLDRKEKGYSLMLKHKRVRFIHHQNVPSSYYTIMGMSWNGMIWLSGVDGEYDPNLLIVEESPIEVEKGIVSE